MIFSLVDSSRVPPCRTYPLVIERGVPVAGLVVDALDALLPVVALAALLAVALLHARRHYRGLTRLQFYYDSLYILPGDLEAS